MIFKELQEYLKEEDIILRQVKLLGKGYYQLFASIEHENGELTFKTIRTNKVIGKEKFLLALFKNKMGKIIHVG